MFERRKRGVMQFNFGTFAELAETIRTIEEDMEVFEESVSVMEFFCQIFSYERLAISGHARDTIRGIPRGTGDCPSTDTT